jgi:hypothetical protein
LNKNNGKHFNRYALTCLSVVQAFRDGHTHCTFKMDMPVTGEVIVYEIDSYA